MIHIHNRILFRVFSSITTNMSAAWFGLVIVTPNFVHVGIFDLLLILTRDVAFGTVFVLLALWLENRIEYDK